jgi:hypothetical protein
MCRSSYKKKPPLMPKQLLLPMHQMIQAMMLLQQARFRAKAAQDRAKAAQDQAKAANKVAVGAEKDNDAAQKKRSARAATADGTKERCERNALHRCERNAFARPWGLKSLSVLMELADATHLGLGDPCGRL